LCVLTDNNVLHEVSLPRMDKEHYPEHQNSHHDETKYMMDQARSPPGASDLPKHMHLVTPINSDSLERRNKKAPTP